MPFDQVNFALPAVETDALLRRLIEGRERIADPTKWAKHATCGDQWCAGLAVSYGDFGRIDDIGDAAWASLDKHVPEAFARYSLPTAAFNDAPETTHADVLALLDRAIAARRAAIASKAA